MRKLSWKRPRVLILVCKYREDNYDVLIGYYINKEDDFAVLIHIEDIFPSTSKPMISLHFCINSLLFVG
jgi:hypothetical protein